MIASRLMFQRWQSITYLPDMNPTMTTLIPEVYLWSGPLSISITSPATPLIHPGVSNITAILKNLHPAIVSQNIVFHWCFLTSFILISIYIDNIFCFLYKSWSKDRPRSCFPQVFGDWCQVLRYWARSHTLFRFPLFSAHSYVLILKGQ